VPVCACVCVCVCTCAHAFVRPRLCINVLTCPCTCVLDTTETASTSRGYVCARFAMHKSSHHLSKPHAHTTLSVRLCELSNALIKTRGHAPNRHRRKMHVQSSMGVAAHAASGAILDT